MGECRDGECTTNTWPTCGQLEEDHVGGGDDQYHDCEEVSVPYMNKTVSCGKDGWKTIEVTTEVGQGVFMEEVRSPCNDCDQKTFQWSTWSTVGNKMVRSRGSNTVEDSYQQEEKSVNHAQCSQKYTTLTETWRQIKYGVPSSSG